MKKFFSFICCMFLAFIGIVPCTFANPPNHGELFYLTARNGVGLRAIEECGTHCWGNRQRADWFTARKYRDGSYSLVVGRHTLNQRRSLGKSNKNSDIIVKNRHGCSADPADQRWVFENAEGGYHRIRNVATGQYLTWNWVDGYVYDFHWVGPGHKDYDGQLWWKH